MKQVASAEVNQKTLKDLQNQKAWKFIHDINSASGRDLNRAAIVTGVKQYTYGLMFRQWERYASVFTALHMTGANHARVGLTGAIAAETIFAFYGLNMVGADVSVLSSFCSLKTDRIKQIIRDEKLTDIIITDDFAQPNLIQELLEQKASLGLRNVILLHLPIYGNGVNSMLAAAQETKYMYMKCWYSPICMDTLLTAYGDSPVAYAEDVNSDTAVILHTSGTTGGVGKPVTLSDQAVNAAGAALAAAQLPWIPKENIVCGLSVDLSNAYSLVNQIHAPLMMHGAIAVVPGGALNPCFYKAIPEQKINILFCISAMFNYWMKLPESTEFDFSGLRCVIIGGTSVSSKDKHRFSEFLRAHGCGEIPIINGYGISELGGACCLSSPDLDDDSIGYALPGVSFRLLDEETKKYLSVKNAPCSGILYLNSPSITSCYLDGKEICKTEIIDKKPYICTNDAVSVAADGKLTFLGRVNRYFINDSGKKYESGRVETEFSHQSGIESCCVVPLYAKTLHDNVPMLCITTIKSEAAAEIVQNALVQVFITDRTLPEEYIPHRVLIAAELPRNANGKIDLYGIQQGHVSGEQYDVSTVRRKERLVDFKLLPQEDEADNMIQDVFKGIAADLKDNLSIKNHLTKDEAMKNPVASFNAMNQLGSQMMNMFGMPNEMNQPNNDRKNAARFFMPQAGIPSQQQMNQMMAYTNQMNRMAWQNAQQMYSQYYLMISQLWQMLQKNCRTGR